jgi:hypothetical protein
LGAQVSEFYRRRIMPDSRVSIEEEREELVRHLTVGTTAPVETRRVHFTNNDVPEYLEKLDRCENQPSRILIPTK